MAKKGRMAEDFRGQLMLQIAAGRFFRPDVPINEHPHRRTVYSNASLLNSVDLPVGKVVRPQTSATSLPPCWKLSIGSRPSAGTDG